MLPVFMPQVDNKSLIQCVQSHEVLYDATHPQYSDARLKDELWEKIAFVMAIPVSLCKRSWFNLRDSYRRALRKRRDAIRDNLPYRRWRFEDEMQFLEQHISIRDPNDKVESQTLVAFEESATDPLDTEPKIKKSRPNSNKKTLLPKSTENYEPRYVNTDHIDAFLMGIGATLKNFTRRNQNLAKSKIFGLVAEMELQQISEYKEHLGLSVEQNDESKESEQGGSESDDGGDTSAAEPNVQLDEDRISLSEDGTSTSKGIKTEKSVDRKEQL